MSEKLPNMLETTIQKIRDMVDANTVVGQPITTSDGTTILPGSKISIGLGGGGSDFASSKVPNGQMPFGGGVGAGVKVTPVCFLVVKEGNENNEAIQALVDALHSDTIRDYITETFDGAVVPAF